MNEIEKLERHLGSGKEIKLKNTSGIEDTFYFKPLTVEFLPKFMKLAKATELTKSEKEEVNKLKQDLKQRHIAKEVYDNKMGALNEIAGSRMMEGENSIIVMELLVAMVELSYPDLKDKPETLGQFTYNNLMPLTRVLMELNEHLSDTNQEALSQIEKLKQKHNS